MTLDEVYEDLLEIVSEVGAQVDVPLESERFFAKVVDEFDGDRQDFCDYVSHNVKTWFRWFQCPPKWLQEAEWQFEAGKPMVFVGQIDIPEGAGTFHDRAAFYVFYAPNTGGTKTIIQVA